MDIDPIDFFPAYEACLRVRLRPRSIWMTIGTHLLAIIASATICAAAFYCYDKHYLKSTVEKSNNLKDVSVDTLLVQLQELKESVDKTNLWRKHLDELFTKIYLQQEKTFDKKVEDALAKYDADKIGLYDYASLYACGSIVSTPDTIPFPANTSISFFKLVNIDLLSNPESILQAGYVPGKCFAFHGQYGRIRIKLGKKITIRSVTLDHLLYTDDNTSAPKNFEVYGLQDPDDYGGILLGQFVFNISGRPYQTFKILQNFTNISFEFVELRILTNYGKREYTCVYRLRVHNKVDKEYRNVCPGCGREAEIKDIEM